MIEEQGKQEKDSALEFRKSCNPSDSFRVNGVEGKQECGEECEGCGIKGSHQQIEQADYRPIQSDVEEVPGWRMIAEPFVFERINDELKGRE
jgi:hypothetical protein